MTKGKQKTCFIYTRESMKMQVEGEPLESQKHDLYQYAQGFGPKIMHEFEDAGFSGKNIEGRPAFNEMIDAIKSGARPDYVIAFKLNRFGRDAEVSRFARHREIQ